MGHGCHDCGCPNGCECKVEHSPFENAIKEAEGILKRFEDSKPEHDALMLKVDAAVKQQIDIFDQERRSAQQLKGLYYQIEERALKAEKRLEEIELTLLCAQDIVDGWPTLTFRTIGGMTKKVDTLKQALDAVKK